MPGSRVTSRRSPSSRAPSSEGASCFSPSSQEPYEARLEQAAAGQEAAEAALRRAESDLERLQQAVKTNAVSEQEVTRARAERDQAAAAVLESRAALTNAQLELGYTTVESPLDGMVSRRNLVDRGNLVGAGEATLLTTVRTIDPMFAYFEVTERCWPDPPTSGCHMNPRTTTDPSDN